MLKTITLSVALATLLFASSALKAETLDTRIGKLEFTHSFADGYPTMLLSKNYTTNWIFSEHHRLISGQYHW